MTDSRVGTFGCAALGMFLLIKVQLLGALGASHWQLYDCSGAGPAIIVSQTIARLSAPYLIRTRDYIAEVGPKSPFYVFMVEAKYLVSWGRLVIATSFSLALACVMYGPIVSTVLITVVLLVAHLMGNKGDYLLGGVMGDFLGSTICVCEIAALTFISARSGIIATYISICDEFDGEGFQLSNVYQNRMIHVCLHMMPHVYQHMTPHSYPLYAAACVLAYDAACVLAYDVACVPACSPACVPAYDATCVLA